MEYQLGSQATLLAYLITYTSKLNLLSHVDSDCALIAADLMRAATKEGTGPRHLMVLSPKCSL